MIRGIYTVRDEASQVHMALQLNMFDEEAVRSFDFAMENNDMMKFKPNDFSLWYLGEYDDQTAIIKPVSPRLIKRGVKKNGKGS